jgi:hypothetical protein
MNADRAFALGYKQAVSDAVRLLRHIESLDQVPGAKLGLPRFNPLWGAGTLLEQKLDLFSENEVEE